MTEIAEVGTEIVNKLLVNGYNDIVDHLNYLESIGSTGGEIVMDFAGYLVKLHMVNHNAYLLIKKELKNYLELCKEYGIYINDSHY